MPFFENEELEANAAQLGKQPIKRLEIPIGKFNDVAVPHHLELLKAHRKNIMRHQSLRDWDRVYAEQLSASRAVKQLKQLLHDMDALRAQVLDADIAAFDKLTLRARTSILDAIREHLNFELTLPLVQNRSSKKEVEEQTLTTGNPSDSRFVQLQAEQEELERQQACLNAWTSLHNDLEQLQELFVDFNKVVHDQAELVNSVEDNVEDVQEDVNQALKQLQQASKYKVVAYPLTGALLGTCLGGPVGFIAGLKLGGLAALGGGLLGYTGGKILKDKRHLFNNLKQIEAPPPQVLNAESSSLANNTDALVS